MKKKQKNKKKILPKVSSMIKESKSKLDKLEDTKPFIVISKDAGIGKHSSLFPDEEFNQPEKRTRNFDPIFDSICVLSSACGFTSLGIAIGLVMR
jgi:hypothetical protein